MIGNAVPVNLARFVGTAINDYLASVDVKPSNDKPIKYIINSESQQLALFDKIIGYGKGKCQTKL